MATGFRQALAVLGATRVGLSRQGYRSSLSTANRRGTASQFGERADTSFSMFMDVALMSCWMRTIVWFR